MFSRKFNIHFILSNFLIFWNLWIWIKLQTQLGSNVDYSAAIFEGVFLVILKIQNLHFKMSENFPFLFYFFKKKFFTALELHCSHFGVLKLTDFHTESRLKLSRISCTRFSFCLAGWAARTLHNKAENPCRLSVVSSPCLIARAGLRESLLLL